MGDVYRLFTLKTIINELLCKLKDRFIVYEFGLFW